MGQVSEHDDEPREAFGASRDEEVPEGVDPETGVIEDQTPAEAAEADGSEEQIKKAERAVATFNKRIDVIFGDNAPPLQCPRCEGLGRVWDVPTDAPDFAHPPELVPCARCNGYGEVLTGSKNPLHMKTMCTPCNGTGWKIEAPQPENVTPLVPAQTQPQSPPDRAVMGWQQPDGTFVPLGTPNAVGG